MRYDPEMRFAWVPALAGTAGFATFAGILSALAALDAGKAWIAIDGVALVLSFLVAMFGWLCLLVNRFGSGRRDHLERKRARQDFPSARVVAP